MNILIGKRQQGKTTHLIKMSAAGEGTIVAFSEKSAKHVQAQAKKMCLDIPEPISWNRLIHSRGSIKGPYLLDELGIVLNNLHIKTATLDASNRIENLPDISGQDSTEAESNLATWAEKEVALAIQAEKAAAEDSDDWNYGAECYKTALRAFQSLTRDGHSGLSIQITKSILNRLIDGRCLTPIEDTPDVWEEIGRTPANDERGIIEYQCKRMSSLFKKVAKDGTITYQDIDRVNAVNIENPEVAYQNGFATRLVDKIFPITMPYLPLSKKLKVVRDQFLVDPANGDYDTVGYLYIETPDGKKIELNRYFKEVDGELVQIEKTEFDERKAKRVDKK